MRHGECGLTGKVKVDTWLCLHTERHFKAKNVPMWFLTGEVIVYREWVEVHWTQRPRHVLAQWMLWSISWRSGRVVSMRDPGLEGRIEESALVIDAKALYDSLKAEVPQIQGDKRTKIEAMIIKEKMRECSTEVKWVSSEVQYSDGLTKQSARQLLADRLRTHVLKLKSDTEFQAAKKKSPAERQKNARKYAMSRAAMKVGGLAHAIFLASMVSTAEGAGKESSQNEWVNVALVTLLVITFSRISVWSIFRNIFVAIWQQLVRPKLIENLMQSLHDEKLVLQEEIKELREQVQSSRQFARKFREQYDEAENWIGGLETKIQEQKRHIVNVEFTVELLREQVQEKEDVIRGKNRVIAKRNEVLDRLRVPPTICKTQYGSRYHCRSNCSHLRNSERILILKRCFECGNHINTDGFDNDDRFEDAECADPKLHDYEEMWMTRNVSISILHDTTNLLNADVAILHIRTRRGVDSESYWTDFHIQWSNVDGAL